MVVVHICVGGGFVGYLVTVGRVDEKREVFRRVELYESK